MNDINSSYYRQNRHEMLSYVPENAKIILDVGCGNGEFGKKLMEMRGAVVWGVEPYASACNQAKLALARVFNTYFSSSTLTIKDSKFDAIIFNDVLEHMVDPQEALEFAKTLLNENGVIVSSIPNIRHYKVLKKLLFNKSFEYKDSGILDKTHLRFFTSSSILAMYTNAGLNVLRHEGINESCSTGARCLARIFPGLLGDTIWLQYATVAQKAI